jgi:putative membrane protein
VSGRETQPERTGLSWQRTGLGVLAVSGLVGHGAVEQRAPLLLVLAAFVALLGLGVLGGLAPLRYRRLSRATPRAAPAAVATATAVVCAAVCAAGAAVLALR